MPTTLPIGCVRLLPIDGRQQVVDVVPLEQPLTQRLERGTPLLRRRGVALRIPALAQLSKLLFVCLAFQLDRQTRRLELRRERTGRRSGFAQLTNLVQLLVECKHLFEQRRWNLACRLP